MGPLDVIIVGQALNDFGLTAFDTVEGLGLNTFGFLWPCNGIWAPNDDTITTAWTVANACGTGGTVEVCSD